MVINMHCTVSEKYFIIFSATNRYQEPMRNHDGNLVNVDSVLRSNYVTNIRRCCILR